MSIKTFTTDLAFKMSKKAPLIALISGTGLIIGAGIMAVAKTGKLHDTIKENSEILKKIDESEKDDSVMMITDDGEKVPYDEKAAQEDRNTITGNTFIACVKTYAIPVGMTLAGTFLIFWSHSKMSKSLAAMTVAYNGALLSLKNYRGRVCERWGEDAEREVFYDIRTKTDEHTDDEGNLKVEETVTSNPDEGLVIKYDKTAYFYRNDPRYIRETISHVADDLGRMYDTRRVKHVFVTELTDGLGLERVEGTGGKGWSEKVDSDRIGADIANYIKSHLFITMEDGNYVAYIDLGIDGMVTI